LKELCDDWNATPTKHSGFLDGYPGDKKRRMIWQFWFADGSYLVIRNAKQGLRLTERMMKAGLIKPRFGDGIRAAIVRNNVNAQSH
jgi:hypothetical protein